MIVENEIPTKLSVGIFPVLLGEELTESCLVKEDSTEVIECKGCFEEKMTNV